MLRNREQRRLQLPAQRQSLRLPDSGTYTFAMQRDHLQMPCWRASASEEEGGGQAQHAQQQQGPKQAAPGACRGAGAGGSRAWCRGGSAGAAALATCPLNNLDSVDCGRARPRACLCQLRIDTTLSPNKQASMPQVCKAGARGGPAPAAGSLATPGATQTRNSSRQQQRAATATMGMPAACSRAQRLYATWQHAWYQGLSLKHVVPRPWCVTRPDLPSPGPRPSFRCHVHTACVSFVTSSRPAVRARQKIYRSQLKPVKPAQRAGVHDACAARAGRAGQRRAAHCSARQRMAAQPGLRMRPQAARARTAHAAP